MPARIGNSAGGCFPIDRTWKTKVMKSQHLPARQSIVQAGSHSAVRVEQTIPMVANSMVSAFDIRNPEEKKNKHLCSVGSFGC